MMKMSDETEFTKDELSLIDKEINANKAKIQDNNESVKSSVKAEAKAEVLSELKKKAEIEGIKSQNEALQKQLTETRDASAKAIQEMQEKVDESLKRMSGSVTQAQQGVSSPKFKDRVADMSSADIDAMERASQEAFDKYTSGN